MARYFSEHRPFELRSVRGLSTGLASFALALSLSSCGVPSQNNAEPVDIQPLMQCPSFEAGGRALQTGNDQIERIVASTLLDDYDNC